ncbi:sulfite exporter TauE/SafE family protein [Archangium lansingense]|uniref:sulfite exporter TauE/SafE family protein n=1 Tax=Archangium lansingense TaxID=2995310 RepID=UPI003B812EBA
MAAASFLAGAMNAVAGGGSFVTFPALVWSGVPSVAANASSSVALFPGSFASAWAYRDDFRSFEGVSVRALLPVSLAGGLTGAMLLLLTPQATFDAVIPWLLLLGTLAFAFGQQAGARLRQFIRIGPALLLGGQFLLSIYGGYFGGAVGLMMMAVWSLFGVSDLRAMNAAKTLLVGVTNTVAVACFIVAGEVWWAQTLLMALGAVAGGYVGARVGRRIPPARLRLGIMAFNVAMTAAFFLRT